jgi:hypothetical protein
MSVCPFTWNNFAPTGRIFMKLYIRGFFKNLSRKLKFPVYLQAYTSKNKDDVTTNILDEIIIHYSISQSDKFGTLGCEPL